jgi:subtilisin family serine protease
MFAGSILASGHNQWHVPVHSWKFFMAPRVVFERRPTRSEGGFEWWKAVPRIITALVILTLSCNCASAETWTVKPKASQESRLAPELDLVQRGGCRFKGICRSGKAVFEVSSEKVNAIRTMSVKADAKAPPVNARSRRLLISYAEGGRKPSAETLEAAGMQTIEDYEQGSFLLVEPAEEVSATAVKSLLDDDAVVYAAPDYIVRATPVDRAEAFQTVAASGTVPNDPLFGHLWGMQNIGAIRAWSTTREAPNIIVAVIDTGVDYNHPDLKANMWSKNGRYGYDFFDNDPDPMDEDSHGTHCAGTIAGVGNNGVGVAGVSWKAQIMAMRFLGADGSGSTSDGVKCIDWAVANGAHILSNSWAGPDTSRELAEAVTRAEQKGVLFVAAAGNSLGNGNNNDTAPYFPASLPNANVISVAAIDVNNARGSFSHYGQRSVDIGAPGVGIVSTVPNGQYSKQDGTSMAAPHVAGAAALIWSRTFASPRQDRTQMTTVRDLIYSNARPVPALKGFWGYNAPAKVPGGVLDLSFLNTPPSGNVPTLPLRIEFRMKVDPAKLR